MNIIFFINSILLGAGLAMDAFSVSLANGLVENKMKVRRMLGISGVYGFFQWFMPLAGYILVHTVAQYFSFFEKMIPWIALALLGYIGGKMILESIQEAREKKNAGSEEEQEEQAEKIVRLTVGTLLVQGIATSIDALSVGFTIADYGFWEALVCAVICGIVTWIISFAGLMLGKKFGTRLAGKATLIGGIILVGIGIEIFISHMIG